MSDYTPTTDEIVAGKVHLGDNYWRELTEDDIRRGLAEHDRQVAERAYKAAEEAAAEALTKWWLTDTSPDEDTSSVMDVRNAIRGLYRAAKGEQSNG